MLQKRAKIFYEDIVNFFDKIFQRLVNIIDFNSP